MLGCVSNGDLVGQLERGMEELARRWERYFARDRQVPTPPDRERAELERRLRELSRAEARSAADQFRLEQLLHRFATYNQMWQRMLREREEARAGSAPPPRPPNETAVAPVRDGGADLRGLFDRYVDALNKAGQDARVSFDGFRRTLEEQRRQLESRGSLVEGFEVVETDAQVRVRARVRRGRQR
jgi:hypothetical protein